MSYVRKVQVELKVTDATHTCCWAWLLLLIICDDEVSLLVFDIEAEAAAMLADDPANANKLALNGLASTMPPSWPPLTMPLILCFDDKAA